MDELGASVQRIFEACCTQADLGARVSDASKLAACQEASASFAHSVNGVLALDKRIRGSSAAVQLQNEHDKLVAELKEKVRVACMAAPCRPSFASTWHVPGCSLLLRAVGWDSSTCMICV